MVSRVISPIPQVIEAAPTLLELCQGLRAHDDGCQRSEVLPSDLELDPGGALKIQGSTVNGTFPLSSDAERDLAGLAEIPFPFFHDLDPDRGRWTILKETEVTYELDDFAAPGRFLRDTSRDPSRAPDAGRSPNPLIVAAHNVLHPQQPTKAFRMVRGGVTTGPPWSFRTAAEEGKEDPMIKSSPRLRPTVSPARAAGLAPVVDQAIVLPTALAASLATTIDLKSIVPSVASTVTKIEAKRVAREARRLARERARTVIQSD